MAKKKATETMDVAVSYGGVSMGRTTRRIQVKIRKGELTLTQARDMLCHSKLECTLSSDPNANGDARGQGKLLDDTKVLTLTAETHRLGVDDDEFEFAVSLIVAKDSLDDGELDSLAFTAGQLKARRIGNAEKKKPDRPAADDGDDDGDAD